MTYATKLLAAAALILAGGIAAHAQSVSQTLSAPAPGQEPPPVADKGTTGQLNCISEDDHYVSLGKGVGFRIEMTNQCEQRIACKVFVYITSAKGAAQGRGTIVLAPKSRGAAAKGAYTMKAKMNGGSSQSTRECRALS
jgi:hypothetical protein